jgi:hypothetical protein
MMVAFAIGFAIDDRCDGCDGIRRFIGRVIAERGAIAMGDMTGRIDGLVPAVTEANGQPAASAEQLHERLPGQCLLAPGLIAVAEVAVAVISQPVTAAIGLGGLRYGNGRAAVDLEPTMRTSCVWKLNWQR